MNSLKKSSMMTLTTFVRIRRITAVTVVAISAPASIGASGVAVYERDRSGWEATAGQFILIAFDDFVLPDGSSLELGANAYSNLPGSPRFRVVNSQTSDLGDPVFVTNPSGDLQVGVPSSSGENFLATDDWYSGPGQSLEGVLEITFDRPVLAVGGVFVDVESNYSTTGIVWDGQEYVFSSPPGDASLAWLGVISNSPISMVRLRMTDVASGNDGSALDDFTYALAGCNVADLSAPFGLHDLADVTVFAAAFLASDSIADLNADGLFDLGDVNLFVTAFVAGCP